MRIALVLPGGVDASGTERVIPAFLWLVERLARQHDVHVFALHQQPEPDNWPLLGACVTNIGTVPGRRRRFLARFAEEHRARAFDVVHALFGGTGVYAAIAAWRHGIPMLLHLAGGEPVSDPAFAYGQRCTWRGRLGFRVAVAGAARITVATRYMQDLAQVLGVPTTVVPLGVALDRWPMRQPRPRSARRPARLLHIGDLRPVKDQLTLLDAVAIMREQGVACELDMAGFDTMDGALQRSPSARRVADITHWRGLLGRAELHHLVSQADLLLHSSRHEAGPLAVLEAAVAGVPTVGTAVGQVADWAPHAAISVPVGDAAAMAREAASLLADDPRRLALAREAQRRAVTADADYSVQRFEELYVELVQARRRTPHRTPAPVGA